MPKHSQTFPEIYLQVRRPLALFLERAPESQKCRRGPRGKRAHTPKKGQKRNLSRPTTRRQKHSANLPKSHCKLPRTKGSCQRSNNNMNDVKILTVPWELGWIIFEFYEHMFVLDGIIFPFKKKKIPTTKSLTLLCVLLRAQPPSPQTAKRLLEILL